MLEFIYNLEYGVYILYFGYISVLSYFIGSIPFGLIFTGLFLGKDIRSIGSGNIGATNVLRTGRKELAQLTLLMDLSKGVLVVFLAFGNFAENVYSIHNHFGHPNILVHFGYSYITISGTLFCGLVAILGHCYPIWLKFKGGKGVATAIGVLLAATPWTGLIVCGAWLASAFAFRISSLAALIALGLAPITTFFIYGAAPATITALITALVFWRHRANIKRLRVGEEPKIGSNK